MDPKGACVQASLGGPRPAGLGVQVGRGWQVVVPADTVMLPTPRQRVSWRGPESIFGGVPARHHLLSAGLSVFRLL